MPPKPMIHIGIGEYYASSDACVIYTVLGSCVAVCLFDPESDIGGMNHILLPGTPHMKEYDTSARYGINAMELLINGIMKLGGNRHRLVAKAFGGANVIEGITKDRAMGQKNAEFVVNFLAAENIKLVRKNFGGSKTRKIYFSTDTGQVLLKRLDPVRFIQQQEQQKRGQIQKQLNQPGQITLFDDP